MKPGLLTVLAPVAPVALAAGLTAVLSCAQPAEPGTAYAGVATVLPDQPGQTGRLPRTSVGPEALVTPAVVDFGAVQTGAVVQADVTVSNVGGEPLVVHRLVFQGPEAFFFEQTGADPETFEGADSFVAWSPPIVLQPGQEAVLQARFEPDVDMGLSGVLRLHTNEPLSRPRPSVLVTGEGAAECPLVDVTHLTFGSVPVGTTAGSTCGAAKSAGPGSSLPISRPRLRRRFCSIRAQRTFRMPCCRDRPPRCMFITRPMRLQTPRTWEFYSCGLRTSRSRSRWSFRGWRSRGPEGRYSSAASSSPETWY
jgi:hypothetical protein